MELDHTLVHYHRCVYVVGTSGLTSSHFVSVRVCPGGDVVVGIGQSSHATGQVVGVGRRSAAGGSVAVIRSPMASYA